MRNGSSGTFVIPWTRTEIDGQVDPSACDLRVGALWCWTGGSIRVDGRGASAPLLLGNDADIRVRAARRGRVFNPSGGPEAGAGGPDPLRPQQVRLSDGVRIWTALVVPAEPGRPALWVFDGAPPPPGPGLRVLDERVSRPRAPGHAAPPGAAVCFTPGTMIRTALGPKPVEALRAGDLVQTMDNGVRPLVWTGHRRVSGARLRAMPWLAPVRLWPGALEGGVPDAALLVSPDHRLLLRGARAEALFGAAEVLVRAGDLEDGRSVSVLRGARQIDYIHLAFERHEVIFANAVPTESFHPGSAGLDGLDAAERARLARALGDAADPERFGGFARRMLTRPEAALLAA